MRLDVFLVENGLAESREKAKHLIRGSHVKINGTVFAKPSKDVKEGDNVELSGGFEYVSRGGYKLAPAIEGWDINLAKKTVADVGCSTGGFTDYAIKHGAKKVYSIDIGDGIHPSLCANKKVVYMPGLDALMIDKLPEAIDVCLVDVTFVPLAKVLEVIKDWLVPGGEVIALIKPPFEKEGGVRGVKAKEELNALAEKVADEAKALYEVRGLVESELEGKSAGQREFFIYLKAVQSVE